jgi:hypothetical protein
MDATPRDLARRRTTPRIISDVVMAALVSFLLWPTIVGAAGSSPGSLHQTSTKPSFSVGLDTQMRTLWRAIEADAPALGKTVFFPRGAYLQMKAGTIVDPSGDYTSRLIGFFDLDLAAYHQTIDVPRAATFLRVGVNPADAAWIPAGACENKIGYWHVPGVRLVFEKGGKVESVEVASLISWRGVWYVVHLGPNPRPTDVGTVDGLVTGPGRPGPAGGC